jgi:hypothetical protein
LAEAAVFLVTAAAFLGAGLAFLTVFTVFTVLTALVGLAVLTALAPFLALFFSDDTVFPAGTVFPEGTVLFLPDAAGVSDDFCVLGMVLGMV